MKIVNTILEIITAPLSFILRSADQRKSNLSVFAKPFVILFISVLVVLVFVFIYYRDLLFTK